MEGTNKEQHSFLLTHHQHNTSNHTVRKLGYWTETRHAAKFSQRYVRLVLLETEKSPFTLITATKNQNHPRTTDINGRPICK